MVQLTLRHRARTATALRKVGGDWLVIDHDDGDDDVGDECLVMTVVMMLEMMLGMIDEVPSRVNTSVLSLASLQWQASSRPHASLLLALIALFLTALYTANSNIRNRFPGTNCTENAVSCIRFPCVARRTSARTDCVPGHAIASLQNRVDDESDGHERPAPPPHQVTPPSLLRVLRVTCLSVMVTVGAAESRVRP
eukprot:3773721-Rhodomonas_salina.1